MTCAGEHFLSGRILSTLRSLMFCLFETFPALLFYLVPHSLAYFVCMCVVMCRVKVIGQLAGVGPLLHYQCPSLPAEPSVWPTFPSFQRNSHSHVCRLTSFIGLPACKY